MNPKNSTIDFTLIWKKINCSLSVDEENNLAKWLHGNEERQAYFNRAIEFYKNGSSLDKNADLIDEGWNKISDQLFNKNIKNNK